MITCPACGRPAPDGTYPAKSKRAVRDGEPWWCPDCLAERIAAAHADDCRCGGCRR